MREIFICLTIPVILIILLLLPSRSNAHEFTEQRHFETPTELRESMKDAITCCFINLANIRHAPLVEFIMIDFTTGTLTVIVKGIEQEEI